MTSFGYKEVSPQEKTNLVQKVFSSVANKYDLMNDAMSLFIHRQWKKKFIEQITDFSGSLLDVAGGTGDIAKLYWQEAERLKLNPEITILDLNFEMLEFGRDKFIDRNIKGNFRYINADAEQLPFADASFDYYTIAFGIRNVTNIEKALAEAFRVLKPGGSFLCIEFGKVRNMMLNELYNLYSFHIIPRMGKILANDRESYQYLVESIQLFPSQVLFKKMIEDSGFSSVKYQDLHCGIATIYQGWRS